MTAMPQNAGSSPTVGSIAYLYDQVTYNAGTSAAVPGRWIQRRQGDGDGSSTLPMAGPIIENDNGLSFRYFAGSSSIAVPTPITDATVRASITRVQVAVGTISRDRGGDAQETKSDTVVITLRNRL
jgi:hypothetical protein